MESVRRREFIGFLIRSGVMGAFGTIAATLESKESPQPILLIGDGQQGGSDQFTPAPPLAKSGALLFIEKRNGALVAENIPVHFLPHGFCLTEGPKVWTFEKWYRGAAIIDLRTRRVVRRIDLPSNLRFFGHAASDGKMVYASAMNDKTGLGVVMVFNEKGEVTDEWRSGGVYPHDCQLDNRTGELIILNSRSHLATTDEIKFGRHKLSGRSCLTWINTQSGRISRQIELKNESGGYAHFHQGGDDQIILTGSMYDSFKRSIPLCAVVDKKGEVRSFLIPNLRGESLSVARSPSGQIAITFPRSNCVLLWNEPTENPRKLDIAEPRGVVWARVGFIVSSAGEQQLYVVDEAPGSKPKKLASHKVLGRGSHLLHLAEI